MGLEYHIKDAIKSLEKEKVSFLCSLELDIKDFSEIDLLGDTKRNISPELISILKDSIQIYPLFGGGFDYNMRFQFIVGLKNDKIKIERIKEDFQIKLRLKKRK